jgi:chaperone required for assembly of F1-ATPase
MRDDLTGTWFPEGQDPALYDPVRSARGAMKVHLPKRFYAEASVGARDGSFAILLDGRPARTKAKNLLTLGTEMAASLVATEWAGQGEFIDPSTMPATRIAHAGIDHVVGARAEVVADILAYAGSDLVCYRAGDPPALVALQELHWQPVLEHIRVRYGARFFLAEGIRHVAQPEESIAALRSRLEAVRDAVALAALHVLTTISGSALIALSIADGVLDAEAGYAAGEVDSDYEVSAWGSDDEAAERRRLRLHDFTAATALLHALEGTAG